MLFDFLGSVGQPAAIPPELPLCYVCRTAVHGQGSAKRWTEPREANLSGTQTQASVGS